MGLSTNAAPHRLPRILAVIGLVMVAAIQGCSGGPAVLCATEDTPATTAEQVHGGGRGRVTRDGEKDVNKFRAECDRFEAVAAQQQTEVWCWAACAEMIHTYYHKRLDAPDNCLTQKCLAERIHGHGPDGSPEVQAASYREVMIALNPELPEEKAKQISQAFRRRGVVGLQIDPSSYVTSLVKRYTVNSDMMVNDICQGHPVVAGLRESIDSGMGHVYVLYSICFSRAKNPESGMMASLADSMEKSVQSLPFSSAARGPSLYVVRSIKMIDPWDGKIVEFTGEEFRDRVDFMISREVAKEVIQGELDTLKIH